MAGKSGRNIKYTAQEDPSFIKRFKERIGYKKDPELEAKKSYADDLEHPDEKPSYDDIEDSEKPVVVVLKPGDLTAEEAELHVAREGHQKTDDKSSFGQISFRKPVKRDASDSKISGLSASTIESKKQKQTVDDGTDDASHSKTNQSKDTKSKSKQTINTSLLSFDDDL